MKKIKNYLSKYFILDYSGVFLKLFDQIKK